MNLLGNDEIPIGLGMALAENTNAMQRFGSMEDTQRQEFVNRSRSVHSKQEMQELVSSLDDGTFTSGIEKDGQTGL